MSKRVEARNSFAPVAVEMLTREVTEEHEVRELFFVGCAGQIFIGVKRTDCRSALIVAGQDLNAAFSFVQSLLARARKLHALLEKLEALFQRQIATLKLAHNSLELFQRRFKVLRVIVLHFKWHRLQFVLQVFCHSQSGEATD
jgi:hypothetical protein